MPRDRNGAELKKGDLVVMEFEIMNIWPHPDYNIQIASTGSPSEILTCNSKLTELLRRAGQQTEG